MNNIEKVNKALKEKLGKTTIYSCIALTHVGATTRLVDDYNIFLYQVYPKWFILYSEAALYRESNMRGFNPHNPSLNVRRRFLNSFMIYLELKQVARELK